MPKRRKRPAAPKVDGADYVGGGYEILVVDDETDGDRIVERGPHGPLRLCALTREPRLTDDLMRFVADPSGEIVADLAGRLPGRGVWITAEKAKVAEAGRINVFARSLKRSVRVPADLADRVETLLTSRVQGALALCNKAGLICSGNDKVDAAVGSGEAIALLHASDGSAGGREKLDKKFVAVQGAKGLEALILAPLSNQQMSLAIGRANVVHAALKPGGAAVKFLSEARRLERFRPGPGSPLDAECIELKKV